MVTRQERLLVALLTTVQFTNITDFVVMMPLGPQLMRAFDIGPHGFGALVSAYNLSAGLSALVASRLLDRFDRKRALILLYAGFILGTVACACAQSYALLMVGRILAGAFGGVLGALVFAIIGDQIPYERRGAAMGAIMTAFSLASVIGVPLGLWAATRWDWHAAFALVALASIPALALAMLGLPRMRAHLVHPPSQASLFGFYRALLADRGHAAALTMMMALTFAGFTIIPFMATYMVTNVGLADGQLAYIYICGGVATIVTARVIGRLADRHGKHRVFVWVALLSLIPLIALTNLPRLPLAAALTVSTIFMILMSGRYIPASAMVTASVAAHQRGAFMSINSATQSLVSGIATTVSSMIIVSEAAGPIRHYDLVGLMSCVAVLAAVWLSRAVRTTDPERPSAPAPSV